MQANLTSHNEISCLIKNSPWASMTLRIDSKEPTTFLIGINPVKCSDTTLLKQNVAQTTNCKVEVVSVFHHYKMRN